MCYAQPGPRCSGHARAKMVAARDNYDHAIIVRDQIPEPFGPRDADNADEYAALDAADAAIVNASTAYAEASREFHTTPEGIRVLEEQIERASVEPSGSTAANLARLQEALIRGRRTRAEQVAAYAATSAPVTAMTNTALKDELSALIETRMPAMAEDPDGLMIEQARFNAVLDEISTRRATAREEQGQVLVAGAASR